MPFHWSTQPAMAGALEVILRVQNQGIVRRGAVDKGVELTKFYIEFCSAGCTEKVDIPNFPTEQTAFDALKNGTD